MIFGLKEGVDAKDLQVIHPALLILLTRTILYCQEHKLPCTITSLINDRKGVKATSRTHESGRAFDLSIKSWPNIHLHRFPFLMNIQYADIGAISSRDGIPRAVVYGDDNHKDHMHIQVRPDAAWNRFIKE